MLYCVNGATDDVFFYAAMAIGGFFVSMNGPNVRSVLQSVTAPEVRGSAFAIYNLTDDLGKGGGPVLVASLVHAFGNRQTAYNVSICFWFICAVMCGLISFSLVADENKVSGENGGDTKRGGEIMGEREK